MVAATNTEKLLLFIKAEQRARMLSDPELARRAGLGVNTVRHMFQTRNANMATICILLDYFGYELMPVRKA